jgi:uncharacterized protein YceK
MKIAGANPALVHTLRLILLCALVLTMGGCSRISESSAPGVGGIPTSEYGPQRYD